MTSACAYAGVLLALRRAVSTASVRATSSTAARVSTKWWISVWSYSARPCSTRQQRGGAGRMTGRVSADLGDLPLRSSEWA